MESIKQIFDTTLSLIPNWGLRVIGGIALLIFGWFGAKILRRTVRIGLTRTHIHATLVPFIGSLVYYLVIVFVGTATLNLFGIQTTSIIAILGAAGLAIGLSLQNTLANFAAGVMLLLFSPFKVGDYIEAGGVSGTVKEIRVFSIMLSTPDNVQVTVANSMVYEEAIKNYSVNDTRRVDLEVSIGYGDNIETALHTIRKILDNDERVLDDPAYFCNVTSLSDSAVNIFVRPWSRASDFWDLKCDLTRALKEELEKAGCTIPYKQQDVHLYKVS
jgi:small conductance mechanosensitive channel